MFKLIKKILFNDELSETVKLFYLVSSLSSIFSLIFALVGLLFRVPFSLTLICIVYYVICSLVFFLKLKYPENSFLSMFLLISTNYIGFPLVLAISEKNFVEIPVYFLIGITYGLVLFKGLKRIIYTSLQMLIDIIAIVYTYYLRTPYDVYFAPLNRVDHLRIAFAIIATGLLCGTVILFRNYILEREMKARKRANLQAEQVSFAKDMFLVNVSHEIITPLNAIIGTTDILLDSDESEHIKEMAYNISNSSHALLSITSDLLDFSKMNTEEVSVNCAEFDISDLLKDVINLMSVRLLDSETDFYIDISPMLPKKLIGDSNKIRQIFVNLLSNAIKYTPSGQIIFRVGFEKISEDKILLKTSVSDTGIGIKKENLEKIFEPHFRSGSDSTDRTIEGNGLGLAYCRKLTNAMHGRLQAESVYTEGSTFNFEVELSIPLPYDGGYCGEVNKTDIRVSYLHDDHCEGFCPICNIFTGMNIDHLESTRDELFLDSFNDESFTYYMLTSVAYDRLKKKLYDLNINFKKLVIISPCNYSYAGEPFEYVLTRPVSCLNLADLFNHTSGFAVRKKTFEGIFSFKNTRILVVDDNLINLGVAKEILEKYNAEVIIAASGREGLICLDQEKIDLIFLDYMMPDMDGIDTLKLIKASDDPDVRNIPVIALTANVVSGAKEMFLEAGFDDYLPKPIVVEKLEKILLNHVNPEKIIIKAE